MTSPILTKAFDLTTTCFEVDHKQVDEDAPENKKRDEHAKLVAMAAAESTVVPWSVGTSKLMYSSRPSLEKNAEDKLGGGSRAVEETMFTMVLTLL